MTGLYLVLYFLSPLDSVIALKGVTAFMIFIGWIAMLLFSIFTYFKNMINNWRLKIFIKTINSDQLNYNVQIDNKYVKIIFEQKVIELLWSEFTSYGLYNDTIYVFNEAKRLDSLFWDRDEMGNESYSALIDLVKQKSIKQTF